MRRHTTPLLLCAGLLAACVRPGNAITDARVDVAPDRASLPDAAADATLDATDGAVGRYVMPACAQAASATAPLSTRCQNFVDAQGRVVLLRGVNARVEGVFDVTFDDARLPLEPIPAFSVDDARRMRALGFNVLRLPLNWSGVEPTETGGISTAYLDRVAAVVELCRQAGLWVLLDFHQDAYSKEIGEDGAPLWAVVPAPTTLLGGPLTDLTARRASAQVLGAFDSFFGATDTGTRLRGRFAQMAAAVAARFANDDTVVGYELYNEPLTDDDSLQAFHLATFDAVRASDGRHWLAFEPPATRNILDRASVPSAPFPRLGAVYAPHIYTLAFTGTDAQRRSFTYATLRSSHLAASNEARAWHTPLFVTEYGYDPAGLRASDYVDLQGDLQDEFGESSAYWVWKERSQGGWGLFDYDPATQLWTERVAVRQALARVYPQAIAGWPQGWQYDRATLRFTLTYDGDPTVTAPTRLYVPAAADFAPNFELRCDAALVHATRDAATGVVEVPCTGAGAHTVTLAGLP